MVHFDCDCCLQWAISIGFSPEAKQRRQPPPPRSGRQVAFQRAKSGRILYGEKHNLLPKTVKNGIYPQGSQEQIYRFRTAPMELYNTFLKRLRGMIYTSYIMPCRNLNIHIMFQVSPGYNPIPRNFMRYDTMDFESYPIG